MAIISAILLALSVVYLLLILYLRRGWQVLPVPERSIKAPHTRVSVLVAARDEELKIGRTIEALLAQDYPKELLEIIIIDDHSTDRTAQIIGSYDGVRLISLQEAEPINSYKKKAIARGIAEASGELIVTTDADCLMGSRWLSRMVAYYESDPQIKLISSPVAYFEEHDLFERLQTLEFMFLIGLGASTIGNRKPSTCNGANLAYERKVFDELGGFSGIDDLASGDDELFLHKVAAAHPRSVAFCKEPETVVYTHAKENLREFIRQRKRWASKSTRYKNKFVVLLGVSIWLFNLLLLVSLPLLLLQPNAFWLLPWLLKILAEALFIFPLISFFRRKDLVILIPLLSLIHPLYLVFIGIAGNSGRYHWKGRMVR